MSAKMRQRALPHPQELMAFEAYRPLLFSIAYRMTGSAMEAEDIIQDAWLRYQTAEEVRNPKAYLAQIVTRLALDSLKAARTQRETYIGPWLPEPILTDEQEIDDTLSLAFMTLLEKLSPLERAIFVLRGLFDYAYAEIASIVERSEATCRQNFRRARARLNAQARFRPSMAEHQALLETFGAAMLSGEMGALEQYLAEEITMVSDGGGKAAAARKPLFGAERVGALVRGLVRNAPPNARATITQVNSLPAYLLWVGDTLYCAMTIEMEAGKIHAIRSVLNPDKLEYLKRQLS